MVAMSLPARMRASLLGDWQQARPWQRLGHLHFAEMLLERGDPRDHGRARLLLTAALGEAEALGMAWVASRARGRLR